MATGVDDHVLAERMKKPRKRGIELLFGREAGGGAADESTGTERDESDGADEGMSAEDDSEASGHRGEGSGAGLREVISRKELARQLRRQAYQRAKAARAADPKHLALKEAAKLRRRELYRQVKESRKARDAEREAARKAAEAKDRAEAKRQLAERVRSVVGPASEPGLALARDIERALQCADVKALIERLRAESPGLAARHRDEDPSA